MPAMEPDEKRQLLDDIRKNGLEDAIVLYEGMILDGRHRAQACAQLGIEPKYKQYEGNDPLGFVISHNLKRRHLNQSQKAIVAAKMIPEMQAQLAEKAKESEPKAPNGARPARKKTSPAGKLAAKLAKLTGTSTRSVERASKLLKKSPKKAEKVLKGEAKLGGALSDVDLATAKKLREGDWDLTPELTSDSKIGELFGRAEIATNRRYKTRIGNYDITVSVHGKPIA